jgi:hypothetical protein
LRLLCTCCRELIKRRAEWLEAGIPEAELIDDMTEDGIK